MEHRRAHLYKRDAEAIGFSFVGSDGVGPVATKEPSDLPFILLHVEGQAHAMGLERIEIQVPGAKRGCDAALDGPRLALGSLDQLSHVRPPVRTLRPPRPLQPSAVSLTTRRPWRQSARHQPAIGPPGRGKAVGLGSHARTQDKVVEACICRVTLLHSVFVRWFLRDIPADPATARSCHPVFEAHT